MEDAMYDQEETEAMNQLHLKMDKSHEKLLNLVDRSLDALAEIKTLFLNQRKSHQLRSPRSSSWSCSAAWNSEISVTIEDKLKEEEIAWNFSHQPSIPIQNQHSSQELQIDLKKESDAPDAGTNEVAADTAEEIFTNLFNDELASEPNYEIVADLVSELAPLTTSAEVEEDVTEIVSNDECIVDLVPDLMQLISSDDDDATSLVQAPIESNLEAAVDAVKEDLYSHHHTRDDEAVAERDNGDATGSSVKNVSLLDTGPYDPGPFSLLPLNPIKLGFPEFEMVEAYNHAIYYDNEEEFCVRLKDSWSKQRKREICLPCSEDSQGPIHYGGKFYTKVINEHPMIDAYRNSFELSLVCYNCLGTGYKNSKESNDLNIITLVVTSNVVLDFAEIFFSVGISNHDTYRCQPWSFGSVIPIILMIHTISKNFDPSTACGAVIVNQPSNFQEFDVDIGVCLSEINKAGDEYLVSFVNCKDVCHDNCIITSKLINIDIHLVVVHSLNHSLTKLNTIEIGHVKKAPSQGVKYYFGCAKGNFDEVVKGCVSVSHVVSSMGFCVIENEVIQALIQENSSSTAFRRLLNFLNSCLKSDSIKNVLFTSSNNTLTANDKGGMLKIVVDESFHFQTKQRWNTHASGWVNVISEFFIAKAAVKFAEENGSDLMSVRTTTMICSCILSRL